ncbi:MAG: pyridoxamine 5'-phosphate oxidase [Myxococcales bacterium]|jgi:pyridoxamine 5'-phosphate oxidase
MMAEDPIVRFNEEYERARLTEAFDASRCALATADRDGRPDARFVLLKSVDDDGFVFYTNFESAKGRELDANPHAALVFHWHTIGIQVRVRGPVSKVSNAEADAYFATRDRGSQLGAWASRQSSVLASREALEEAVAEVARRFENVSVPRPPFWGGYRLHPTAIEFWEDRSDRLHDRWLYERDGGSWHAVRLYP